MCASKFKLPEIFSVVVPVVLALKISTRAVPRSCISLLPSRSQRNNATMLWRGFYGGRGSVSFGLFLVSRSAWWRTKLGWAAGERSEVLTSWLLIAIIPSSVQNLKCFVRRAGWVRRTRDVRETVAGLLNAATETVTPTLNQTQLLAGRWVLLQCNEFGCCTSRINKPKHVNWSVTRSTNPKHARIIR